MIVRRRISVLLAILLSLLSLGLILRKGRIVDYKTVKAYPGSGVYEDYENKILLAISSPPKLSTRRDIIRASWISHIKKLGYKANQVSAFFYMSTPDPEWKEVIDGEEKAYKDLYIINSLKSETSDIANSVKTTELFTQLLDEQCSANGCNFRWICKVDDDSYLVIKTLMERYLLNSSIVPEKTLIGRTLEYEADDGGKFVYPGGQFWCASHDLLPTLVDGPKKVHPDYNLDGKIFFHDDVLTGEVFYQSKTDVNIISLPNKYAHDVDSYDIMNGGGDEDAYHHAPMPESINVHKMKEDNDYLKVTTLYDENGWIYK